MFNKFRTSARKTLETTLYRLYRFNGTFRSLDKSVKMIQPCTQSDLVHRPSTQHYIQACSNLSFLMCAPFLCAFLLICMCSPCFVICSCCLAIYICCTVGWHTHNFILHAHELFLFLLLKMVVLSTNHKEIQCLTWEFKALQRK